MAELSFVRSLELLNEVDSIDEITKLLDAEGFKLAIRKRGCLENYFYHKDGVVFVFALIYKTKSKKFFYTLMDYPVYTSRIESDASVILNAVQRGMGDYKVVARNRDYINEPIHRWAVDCDGRQVDHKTHNALINIREYLTACTSAENNRNKPCYCKIGRKSFSAPASLVTDVAALCDAGFSISRGRIHSPLYDTVAEMRNALDSFESKYLGSFRYNPLIDFQNTWYALVVQKMLGGISDVELYEYNRAYMLKNHADIAQYYQLAI